MIRRDPHRAFRFRVEIAGIEQGGFQSVSGLERVSQVEPYREGGVNDYEHQHVVLTTYPPLVLGRGLVDPELWAWHQAVISGEIVKLPMSVVLNAEDGSEAWRWLVIDAFPTRWEGPTLDAQATAVATESIEFSHHGLVGA